MAQTWGPHEFYTAGNPYDQYQPQHIDVGTPEWVTTSNIDRLTERLNALEHKSGEYGNRLAALSQKAVMLENLATSLAAQHNSATIPPNLERAIDQRVRDGCALMVPRLLSQDQRAAVQQHRFNDHHSVITMKKNLDNLQQNVAQVSADFQQKLTAIQTECQQKMDSIQHVQIEMRQSLNVMQMSVVLAGQQELRQRWIDNWEATAESGGPPTSTRATRSSNAPQATPAPPPAQPPAVRTPLFSGGVFSMFTWLVTSASFVGFRRVADATFSQLRRVQDTLLSGVLPLLTLRGAE